MRWALARFKMKLFPFALFCSLSRDIFTAQVGEKLHSGSVNGDERNLKASVCENIASSCTTVKRQNNGTFMQRETGREKKTQKNTISLENKMLVEISIILFLIGSARNIFTVLARFVSLQLVIMSDEKLAWC